MRRLMCGAVLAGLFLVSVAPAQSANKEELVVRETVQKVHANWATLNPDTNDAYYAPDAHLAFFDLAPLKYDGWAEYKEGAKKMLAGFKELKLHLNDDLAVHVSGKLACATGTWAGDSTSTDGKTAHMEGRYTDVLEKRGSKWIVVHEHFSVPAQI